MERLTSNIDFCKMHCDLGGINDCLFNDKSKCYENNIYNRLREYEIAEEQGLLPKFHLGDEFWTSWLGKPLKAKIVMLQQKKNGLWKYRFCDEQSHTHDYEENEFGKYFWTTKEEAEQALKQMGE